MSILSAQTIRKHCTIDPYGKYGPDYNYPNYLDKPLITPFIERGVIRGRSYGLSACTYDCRIDRPLIIPVRQSRLAVTIERFCFPNNICGSVLDKSSWARLFVSAFNTHLDPGWEGYLTVELSNLGEEYIEFQAGDPVCQVKFEFLDQPTELPYRGKYQNQLSEPTPAILESEIPKQGYDVSKGYITIGAPVLCYLPGIRAITGIVTDLTQDGDITIKSDMEPNRLITTKWKYVELRKDVPHHNV